MAVIPGPRRVACARRLVIGETARTLELAPGRRPLRRRLLAWFTAKMAGEPLGELGETDGPGLLEVEFADTPLPALLDDRLPQVQDLEVVIEMKVGEQCALGADGIHPDEGSEKVEHTLDVLWGRVAGEFRPARHPSCLCCMSGDIGGRATISFGL